MSPTAICRFPALALGPLSLALLTSVVHGGGQPAQTAYHNFPEVPSGWYATGCCDGAVVVDDIHFAPGTEGMQLAQIQARLYVWIPPDHFTLHLYHFDEDTGMPGDLLGTKELPPLQTEGYQVVTVDVWDMDIQIPASGRLWIGFYVPANAGGWNLADADPTIGSSGNFHARNGGDGFTVSLPFDEVQIVNLMLSVQAGPDPCPADTNHDGVVDVQDMLEVILAWGNCFDV